MTTKNTGGPAFPLLNNKIGYHADIRQEWYGVTVRDYFAAKAMQGLLANSGGPVQRHNERGWDFVNCELKEVAATAFSVADAMLKARENT